MSDLFTDQIQCYSIDKKAAREISDSMGYVLKWIDYLYNHGRKTTYHNIKRVVFQTIEKHPVWNHKFYLGPNTSIKDFLQTMEEHGVIAHIGGMTDLGYMLTKDGKRSLEYIVSQMKNFKTLGNNI